MPWIVIDDATGMMLTGPVDEEPTAETGQTALDCPPGYGTDWLWDATTRGRKDVVVAAPPLITVGRFYLLLTQGERIAMRAAASENDEVMDFLSILPGFTDGISLQDPVLVEAIGQMQAAGLLTEARAAAVLAGEAP
jgi:hypothetical protein